eukprot:jgi/Tetstr1/464815/TSEL_009554.t1
MAEGATDSVACSAPDASLVQPSNTGRKPQKPRPKKDTPPKIHPRVNARTSPRLILAEAEPASPDGTTRPMVCKEAWMFIHKVGFLRLRRIRAEVDGLVNPSCSRNARHVYHIASRAATRAWLKDYFDPKHGGTEKIPNPSSDREEWHLPARANKAKVYMTYMDDDTNWSSFSIAKKKRDKLWERVTTENLHVEAAILKSRRRPNMLLCIPTSACTKCVACTELIRTSDCPVTVSIAKKKRDKLWERVTTENLHVEAAILKSRRRPNMLLCEIDGMDSSKTLLPHSATLYVFDAVHVVKDKLPKVHLTCVKYNGMRLDDVLAFTDIFPHDSCYTITVMWLTILKDLERRGSGAGLEPLCKVHFQLDNTCRENKNRYVMCFAEWLVSTSVVEEVVLSFLPVGHTHERIDQVFSKFSRRLGGYSAKTLPKLFRELRQAFTHLVCNFEILEGVIDWKEFLGGALPTKGHVLSISHAYQFSVRKLEKPIDHAVQAEIFMSQWSDTDVVHGPEHFMKYMPEGKPSYLHGRPIFHSHKDGRGKTVPLSEVEAEKRFDDMESHILFLAAKFDFYADDIEEWVHTFAGTAGEAVGGVASVRQVLA